MVPIKEALTFDDVTLMPKSVSYTHLRAHET